MPHTAHIIIILSDLTYHLPLLHSIWAPHTPRAILISLGSPPARVPAGPRCWCNVVDSPGDDRHVCPCPNPRGYRRAVPLDDECQLTWHIACIIVVSSDLTYHSLYLYSTQAPSYPQGYPISLGPPSYLCPYPSLISDASMAFRWRIAIMTMCGHMYCLRRKPESEQSM